MSNEKMIPLSEVIQFTERIKKELIANYPNQGEMFFSFGANSRAVAVIDGWILNKTPHLEHSALSVRQDSGPAIVLGPMKEPPSDKR